MQHALARAMEIRQRRRPRGARCRHVIFEQLEARRLLAAIESWSQVGPGGGGALFSPSINPHDPAEMFIPSDMSQLFRSSDEGTTWATLDFREIQGNWATDVRFTSNPDVLYAVDYSLIDLIDSASPARSEDGGVTWQRLAGDPTDGGVFTLLADYNEPDRVIVTDWQRLYVSQDGGASFQERYSTDDGNAGLHVGGAFFDGGGIYIGTNQGLLTSDNGGQSFSVEPLLGIPADERVVSFAGATENGTTRFFAVTMFQGDVFAGVRGSDHGGYLGVYKRDLGQSTWTRAVTGIGPDANPFFVAAAAGDIDSVYVGGGSDGGTPIVYKSTNGGENWTEVLQTDGNHNVATGWSGDGGVRGWSYGENLFGLTMARNDPNRVLVTDFGFAHYTADGGETWQVLNVHPEDRNAVGSPSAIEGTYRSSGLDNTSIWGVTWVDESHLIGNYSDIRGAISADGGQSWTFDYTGHNQNSMYRSVVSDSGVVYAATSTVHDMYQSTHLLDSRIDGGGGRVLASLDKGKTWITVHDFGNVVTWVELDPTNPNRLYAAVAHSTQGGVYVSDNIQDGANSTWRKLSDPPRTEGHAFNIRVLDDGALVATFSGRRTGSPTAFTPSSGVFVSTDGGQSWVDRSDNGMRYWTRDIEIDPHDATQNTWYASVFSGWGGPPNGLGGLYKTTNRGLAWQRIVDLDRVASSTVSPKNPDEMYLTTESEGLWYSEDLNSNSNFAQVASYPFRNPMRIDFNPFDLEEVWVSSFGNGLLVGRTQPESLQVASVTPTSGGFIVDFNAELDTGALNLYDAQTASLGPADVILEGASSGRVTGSLIVDSSRKSVAFQKSGQPLAPDTYTLTLRGGNGGFADLMGQALDGNGDGVGGDDFSAPFTVGDSDVNSKRISVQDFVRGPGQAVNLPADSSDGIPISISDGSDVRTIEFQLAYDPGLLRLAAGTVGTEMPPGATVDVSEAVPGIVNVAFSSPIALPAGPTDFAHLVASVPTAAGGETAGQQQLLDIRGISVSDGNGAALAAADDDSIHVVSYFGDVSSNGRINANDAAQLARVAALLDAGFASHPLVDPAILADISRNGRVNAADASLVAQVAALIDVPAIPPIPAGGLAPSSGRPLLSRDELGGPVAGLQPARVVAIGFKQTPSHTHAQSANQSELDHALRDLLYSVDRSQTDSLIPLGLL